jgi:hypothetical protein
MKKLELMATIQPGFPHFARFSRDTRLSGVRLNNPHWTAHELECELRDTAALNPLVPLYFDVKGWQLRVTEVHYNERYLDITLNHPINVELPTVVIFKAGADSALLERIEDDGHRLIFRGGPCFLVKPGESLQIRNPSLRVLGEQFCTSELEKIEVAKKLGISRYFLSYVERQSDVDSLRELVGRDAEIMLKIENLHGLSFVEREFKKQENTRLVAARGDLYVEVNRPHDILQALQLIISKDPDACVGSRLMLSVIHEAVPSCADFLELAWLYDVGYRSMMLCDELCLKEELLARAINATMAFGDSYVTETKEPEPAPIATPPRSDTTRRGWRSFLPW